MGSDARYSFAKDPGRVDSEASSRAIINQPEWLAQGGFLGLFPFLFSHEWFGGAFLGSGVVLRPLLG